jgi:hypothetical protein
MARRVGSETAEKTRSSAAPLYSSTRVNIAVSSGHQPPEFSLVVQPGSPEGGGRTARINSDVDSSPGSLSTTISANGGNYERRVGAADVSRRG